MRCNIVISCRMFLDRVAMPVHMSLLEGAVGMLGRAAARCSRRPCIRISRWVALISCSCSARGCVADVLLLLGCLWWFVGGAICGARVGEPRRIMAAAWHASSRGCFQAPCRLARGGGGRPRYEVGLVACLLGEGWRE